MNTMKTTEPLFYNFFFFINGYLLSKISEENVLLYIWKCLITMCNSKNIRLTSFNTLLDYLRY